MECPHCKYKTGWDGDSMSTIEGKKGDFYKLSNDIILTRSGYMDIDTAILYACPDCGKTFIEV